jgi:amino acid transporter
MVISGWGHSQAVAAAGKDPVSFFYVITQNKVGTFAKDLMQWLILTGSFACALAFHNAASRYNYNLGREGVFPRALGRTHPKYKSPYIASFTQSAFAATIVAIFVITNKDPYVHLYVWMAVLGTFALLVVQTLVSVASIAYFERYHPEDVRWWQTRIAPAVGAIGMIVVSYLLVSNLTTLGGDFGFIKAIPWIVLGWFLAGLILAYYLRARQPEKYATVGRMINQGIQ